MADAQGAAYPVRASDDGEGRPLGTRDNLYLTQRWTGSGRQQLDDGFLGRPSAREALPPVGAAAGGQLRRRIDPPQEPVSVALAHRADARHRHYVHSQLFHVPSIAAMDLEVCRGRELLRVHTDRYGTFVPSD